MKTVNQAKAWEILIERKSERKESRIAFIAALLVSRCGESGKLLPPHMAEAFAVEFVRLARSIKGLCEAACNYEQSAAQEKRLANLEARFFHLANALGFEARTGGDPRGACAYLIDPADRRGDGWGEGWAIYA